MIPSGFKQPSFLQGILTQTTTMLLVHTFRKWDKGDKVASTPPHPRSLSIIIWSLCFRQTEPFHFLRQANADVISSMAWMLGESVNLVINATEMKGSHAEQTTSGYSVVGSCFILIWLIFFSTRVSTAYLSTSRSTPDIWLICSLWLAKIRQGADEHG